MAKQNPDKEEPEVELPEVQHELSKVATNPKQNILILVIFVGVFGYLAFNLFFNNKNPDEEVKTEVPTEISKPVQTTINDVPAIPQLPEPPKIVEPTPPSSPPVVQQPTPLPPTSPTPPAVNDVTAPLPPPITGQNDNRLPVDLGQDEESSLPSKLSESDEAKKRKDAKRKSAIVLVAGTPEKKTPEQVEQESEFKYRGATELLLGRGKIIDAVLESAINTDFGGEVRAVVSRDVYSESGKIILIPKGSRVFGNYAAGTDGAYGRISIEWARVDLTSGYTLNMQSKSVDNLGRGGINGRVDNKFKERISNSILMSAFNIGFANAIDKLVAPPISSQAATTNQQIATNINNIAQAINADTTKDPNTKIQLICTNVQAAITDKTSTVYTNFVASCLSLTTPGAAATPAQNLLSLMSSVSAASAALLTNTTTQVTPTKAQDASKQAFTDVTNTVKDMVTQQQFKQTVTIDQGTPIKIYVNKDYKFPKAALSKSRLIQ